MTLFPLDITTTHVIERGRFDKVANPLVKAGSPLAEWMTAFMTAIFKKMETLHHGHAGDTTSMSLHDPLCVWYVLTRDATSWIRSEKSPEDIRIETTGQVIEVFLQ